MIGPSLIVALSLPKIWKLPNISLHDKNNNELNSKIICFKDLHNKDLLLKTSNKDAIDKKEESLDTNIK